MVMAEVSDDIASGLSRRIQPTFGYYRQPNGWITISPVTRLEQLKYTEEGWEYLEAYGAFDVTAYTVNHPFESLFMFGGAKEMSVDQVIQTGLYFDPPLVPQCKQHLTQYHRSHSVACWRGAKKVEFPQLADVPKDMIGPFVCDFCKRKMPTREALDQHQGVAHSKPLGNIQMGRSLGTSLAEVIGNRQMPVTSNPDDGVLQRRIKELEQVAQAKPVAAMETCGCATTYKVGGKTFHQRSRLHQKWAKKQGIAQMA